MKCIRIVIKVAFEDGFTTKKVIYPGKKKLGIDEVLELFSTIEDLVGNRIKLSDFTKKK